MEKEKLNKTTYELVETILNENLDKIIDIVKSNLNEQEMDSTIMKCLRRYFKK